MNKIYDTQIIDKAMNFAVLKHSGQLRKGTTSPYIVHIYEVMQILKDNNADEKTIVAGILHDTLEDTHTTYEELISEFGKEIAYIVKLETEDKTKPYAERKAEHMLVISKAPIEAKMINCADKLSNIRNSVIDFRSEGESFWSKFNGTKEEIQTYYKFALECLKDVKYTKMYKEFEKKYNELFQVLIPVKYFVSCLSNAQKNELANILCDGGQEFWFTYSSMEQKNNKLIMYAESNCDYTVSIELTNISATVRDGGDETTDKSKELVKYLYKVFGSEYKKAYFEDAERMFDALDKKLAKKSAKKSEINQSQDK